MICVVGCAETNSANVQQQNTEQNIVEKNINEAKVLSVKAQGKAQNYTFNVGISSPDTGCEQYANWWEVLNEEGKLLYRRILAHSHVKEQPFERSGGPVTVNDNEIVIIRAHVTIPCSKKTGLYPPPQTNRMLLRTHLFRGILGAVTFV